MGLQVSHRKSLERSSRPVFDRYDSWSRSLGEPEFIVEQHEERTHAKDAILVSLDGEITMLRKLMVVLIVLGTLCACRRHKDLIGDHPLELVGTWQLLIRSSCDQYGIKSDTLNLRADGTFEQHVTSKDGKQTDLTGQHWKYDANGHTGDVELDKRLESFTPEHLGGPSGNAVGTFEVLIVDVKSEPVIVVNPDSDCVYSKIR